MLDDLYAVPDGDTDTDTDTDVVTYQTPTRAPSWSSEEALDEAFSSWVPGESDGTTAFERSLAEDVGAPATLAEALHVDVDVDDWLSDTEPLPEPELVVAGLRRWSPSDDDILPARRRARGRRR